MLKTFLIKLREEGSKLNSVLWTSLPALSKIAALKVGPLADVSLEDVPNKPSIPLVALPAPDLAKLY